MHSRSFLKHAFFALIFFSVNLMAAEQRATPVIDLTIDRAVQIALDQNPDILDRKEKLKEVDSSFSMTITQALPKLDLSANATYQKSAVNTSNPLFGGEPYNQYGVQLHLTQPIYQGGAIRSSLGVARHESEIRQLDLELTMRDLSFSVLQTFYQVLLHERNLKALKETETLQRESLATAEKYYKIGRGQLIDVLQIKTQLALLTPKIEQTANQQKIATAKLTTLLHQTDTDNIRVAGKLASITPETIGSAIKQKRSELLELSQAREQISRFEREKDVELSVHWPELNLVGSLGRSAYANSELLDSYSTSWSLSLQLSFPIFSGLSSIYQRRVLESQGVQLELKQTKLMDQLLFNQVQAQKSLDTATIVLQASHEAAKLAQAALKQAKKDYGVQTINYLQLLTSQQNLLDAQSAFNNAKYSYVVAAGQYFIANGIPLSRLIDILEHSTAHNTTNEE